VPVAEQARRARLMCVPAYPSMTPGLVVGELIPASSVPGTRDAGKNRVTKCRLTNRMGRRDGSGAWVAMPQDRALAGRRLHLVATLYGLPHRLPRLRPTDRALEVIV